MLIVELIALYVLGTYLIAAVIGHTTLFKEKVNAVIDKFRAKRNAKKTVKVKQIAEVVEPTEPEVELEQ